LCSKFFFAPYGYILPHFSCLSLNPDEFSGINESAVILTI
jgi:hypothetical protein